ncbi:DUF2490 domain-containing protein [Acanthopleuribacter pedis]|uniref:DUF2490 domain-containing protein n=1 Tax=Acanthopleuribacter pedis TaxID=442870 RepID=A0A8J7U1M6_9BACT|nr:DUF2490 domain-containing protein [Acanthopleuribacter pedis]MBO1317687.1 DUF2490 domain-containing protein [Acanthopleuribacter pedis]
MPWPLWATDDGHAWLITTTKLYQKDRLKLGFYYDQRMRNDGSRVFGYFYGPTVSYQTNLSWLQVGGGLKFMQVKSGDSGFALVRRPEVEFSLQFKMAGAWRYSHRNRYEYLSRKGREDNDRFRSRPRFTRSFKRGPVAKFYADTEWFYRPDDGRFERNRLVPVGITWRTKGRVGISSFYMWEHIRGGSRNNHILGTSLSF